MILDGKKIAAQIRAELREEVEAMRAQGKRAPKLGIVIVGNNPASETYVNNKMKACAEVGIEAVKIAYPSEITEQTLLNEVRRLNNDDAIDGFIVQLPLPEHIRGRSDAGERRSYGARSAVDHQRHATGHSRTVGAL